MVVTVSLESVSQNKKRKRRKRRRRSAEQTEDVDKTLGRPARMVVDPICSEDPQCSEVCVCLRVCLHGKHFSFFINFLSPHPINSRSAAK